MPKTEALKPCPFCGGEVLIQVSDDEGNMRSDDYESDPWSGLSFALNHPNTRNNPVCPIANHDGEILGTLLYESRSELIKYWNMRIE
ncbi:hypothetical protein KP77_25280 [Jeotgalibacillus alimentarius]|uniref:Uncharacterized protein n=1 Tax=Jeotgalibacillus alimentarius TaxID=135826 RepID=A0A0C2RYT2_9BACL|nr:hypothetical protein [Jeotgalibacillus alimentarius]KIL46959.1 hypothetical protein KP77_25280 [Jeotgalibacillus alimentarius]